MRKSGEPLYLQIAKILQEEVINNHAAGDKLESEGRIAERFGVNRHTIRRSIGELVDQGYLERRQGLGVFVNNRPLKYELHSETRISTNFAKMGISRERTFIKRQVSQANREIAQHLKIRKGQKVAILESLVIAEKLPLCVCTHYFAHQSHKEIYDSFKSGSLHSFIENTYHIKLKRKTSFITAMLPTREEAALLKIMRNQSVLRIRSVNVNTETEKPVEYVVARFRSDRVDLKIDY